MGKIKQKARLMRVKRQIFFYDKIEVTITEIIVMTVTGTTP